MLIADTFKQDRQYVKSFRRLLVISLQKRSEKSVLKMISTPRRSYLNTQLTKHKYASSTLDPQQAVPSKSEHIKVGQFSAKTQCLPYQSLEIVQGYRYQANYEGKKARNFFDSNIDKNNYRRHQSHKRNIKPSQRCNTEAKQQRPLQQLPELAENTHSSAQKAPPKKPYPRSKKMQPQCNLRKPNYTLMQAAPKPNPDKENEYSQFCPWNSGDPYSPTF